jgi:hypothetical protein
MVCCVKYVSIKMVLSTSPSIRLFKTASRIFLRPPKSYNFQEMSCAFASQITSLSNIVTALADGWLLIVDGW